MGKQANIKNVDAIDGFRAEIREFQQIALRELDSMRNEVRRMEAWITLEQPPVWKMRSRKVESEVNNARSDLERAKISRPDQSPRMFADQKKALQRAQAKQQMTMTRIRDLKRWGHLISQESMVMQSGLQALSNLAGSEMLKLQTLLKVIADHLDSYLQASPNSNELDEWASHMQSESERFTRSGEENDPEVAFEDNDAPDQEESVDGDS